MHKQDTWIGIGSGLTGGFIKYTTLTEIQISFSHKLFESVVIAALCSLTGLLIKEAYNFIKRKLTKDVGTN